MGQSETATQHDTAANTLPLLFASNGQIAEAVPSGFTASHYGAETPTSILLLSLWNRLGMWRLS
jgi:hypothetical protein